MRHQAVALDKGIVPVHRNSAMPASVRENDGDVARGDFLDAFELVRRWPAIVSVAADNEPFGPRLDAGLRRCVITAAYARRLDDFKIGERFGLGNILEHIVERDQAMARVGRWCRRWR